MKSGTGVTKAMSDISDTANLPVISLQAEDAEDAVSLSQEAGWNQTPEDWRFMIASGEASGELDDMLSRVARHMQQDVEMLLSVLLSLFGPLMLIIMGGAVFIIVVAILLPIINLNQLVA